MLAAKLLPHLLASFGILLVLLRCFVSRRPAVMVASICGLAGGALAVLFLRSVPVASPYLLLKSLLGVGFFTLWGVSVAVNYQKRGTVGSGERCANSSVAALVTTIVATCVAGGIVVCKLPDTALTTFSPVFPALAAVILAGVLAAGARLLENRLSDRFTVTPLGMMVAVVALLLFSASSILRLDLFSPLSMKVMKGVHDLVHQSMESILIPDHVFVRPVVWKYIGFLFGKEVGFWGGMVIWFTPPVLIALAVGSRRLPAVGHIRQGAQRRKLRARALREQRLQLLMPLFALCVLAGAAYQSSFPTVEYWDPKPILVVANEGGMITLPKKGDILLEDGKIHKYLFKQKEREARFFVLLTPEGQLTVDLDACAICKPDGYGQAEGSVICYYCKTLIPLDTVGKPGGCNPVPIPFTVKDDAVVIDAMTLINTWGATVRATARVKEGGK